MSQHARLFVRSKQQPEKRKSFDILNKMFTKLEKAGDDHINKDGQKEPEEKYPASNWILVSIQLFCCFIFATTCLLPRF